MGERVSEDWSTAEIVRAIQGIQGTLKQILDELHNLNQQFVPRELHDQQLSTVRREHNDLAKWVTDIAAQGERTRAAVAENKAAMVTRKAIWLFVGVLIAGISAAEGLIALFLHTT